MSDVSNITTLSALTDEETIFCDGDWIESKDQDENGKVRLIQLADIGDGEFRNRSNRFMTLKRAKELNCTFLKKNDVLVARMPDPLGRACIFPLEEENTYVTVVDIAVFRPNPKKVNPNYIAHLVNSPQFRNEIDSRQSGTTRRRISRSNLGQIDLPVPLKKIQDKSAIKIDLLFSQVIQATTELKTAQEKLSLYNQSILNSAIQGKLVPQDPKDEPASKLLERIQKEKDKLILEKKIKKEKPLPPINIDEMPFEIPKGWEWVRVGTIAETCLGKMLDKSKNKGKPKPYLRNINVRWFDFKLDDILEMKFEDSELERFTIQKNDLVICEGGEPGRCAVWSSDETIYFQKALHRVRPFSKVSPDFLALCLKHEASSGRLKSSFTGSGIMHFTGEQLKSYIIPLPPLKEQARIIKAVREAMDSATSVEKNLEDNLQRSDLLKQSILKKAFEGELV